MPYIVLAAFRVSLVYALLPRFRAWWTPFLFALLLMGWVPVNGGWLAGWLVSRLPDSPAEEKH